MKLKSLSLIIAFAGISFSCLAQAETPRKETKQERKVAEARENAAKADASLHKNDIYDAQVLNKTTEESQINQNSNKRNRVRTHFRKRKLHHRLRRRRF